MTAMSARSVISRELRRSNHYRDPVLEIILDASVKAPSFDPARMKGATVHGPMFKLLCHNMPKILLVFQADELH
jgi:hypothetical protein